MSFDDVFCRWQRARLGEEYVDSDGQRWVHVVVPHDGDPRGDVRELCDAYEAVAGSLLMEEGADEPKPKRRRKGGAQ